MRPARGRGPLGDLLGAFSFRRVDPDDLEANYRKPIPRREYVRTTVKFVIAIAAGIWFRFAILDGSHEGADMTVALGTALAGLGLVDLVYLRRHEIELIFLRTKEQQTAVRWGMVVAGAVLVAAALAAYAG